MQQQKNKKNKIKTCLSNMKSLPISFILKNRKAITFKILYTMFSMNKSLCELQKRCKY